MFRIKSKKLFEDLQKSKQEIIKLNEDKDQLILKNKYGINTCK
jgi:hypothetical protein